MTNILVAIVFCAMGWMLATGRDLMAGMLALLAVALALASCGGPVECMTPAGIVLECDPEGDALICGGERCTGTAGKGMLLICETTTCEVL